MQIEETKKKKKRKIESSDNNTSLKSKKKYRKQVKISLSFLVPSERSEDCNW
jgi:hypothetical protein